MKAIALGFARIALALAALTALAVAADGSSKPKLEILSIGPARQVPVSIEAGMQPSPAFEIPPVVVAGLPGSFFASTGWSWLCRSKTPVTAKIDVDSTNCLRFSTPGEIDFASGQRVAASSMSKQEADWGRNYLGAFSAVKLPWAWRGYDAIAIMHGENKNETIGTETYANTVDTEVDPKACTSGYAGGTYSECYAAYNGFISVRLFDSSGANRPPQDLGPILWSTMPYRTNGKKTSYGLRHPSAVVDGGFLYIFYVDGAQSPEIGREAGFHVARMAIPKNDAEEFGEAAPYYNGAFQGRSLPPGFDKARIRTFYDRAGSPASDLWAGGWRTARFAVSRIQGERRFIGVDWLSAAGVTDVRLRVSDDLVNWSGPVSLSTAKSRSDSSDGPMLYPVLTNLTGDTSMIDPAAFYILGSSSDAQHAVLKQIGVSLSGQRRE